MSGLRRIAVAALSVIALAAIPASASAQDGITPGPIISINNPTDVAYDPFEPIVYVSSPGPPPRIEAYDEESGAPLGSIPLPSGADPGVIEFDAEGDLVVIDRSNDLVYIICGECGEIVATVPYPSVVRFVVGYVNAFLLGQIIADFGIFGTEPGSLFYGPGFATEFPFGPPIHLQGIDLLPGTGKIKKGRIASEILLVDRELGQIHSIPDTGDAITGSQVVGVVPGTAGVTFPTDINVSPINLSQSAKGKALHPVMVPIPDLGNVYWSPGPGGPWAPLSASNFGFPSRVDSDCLESGDSVIGVVDGTNDKVSTFFQDLPKGADCPGVVSILPSSGSGSSVDLRLQSFVDAKAKVSVSFIGGGETYAAAAGESASAAKSTARLTAGKVKTVKIKITGEAREKLQRSGKVRAKLKIKLKTASGAKTKITEKVKIKKG